MSKTKISRRDFVKSLTALPVAASIIGTTEKAKAAFYNVGGFWRSSTSSGSSASGDIAHSLRLRQTSSAYVSRTFTTPTNNKKWTYSVWAKRSSFLSSYFDLPLLASASNAGAIGISGSGAFGAALDGKFYINVSGTYSYVNVELRDPASWYHFVVVVDTDNGTPNDRQILYINGVRQPNFSSTYSPGASPALNSARDHFIGGYAGGGATPAPGYYGDGYIARVAFVDGQALSPSSFGTLNSEINEWTTKNQSQVKAVVDAGGTNSFMLDFDDGTNTTTLGYDKSSKGNHWTCNNISLTAGTTYDWMLDVPGNSYCTLNPLPQNSSASLGITNGNLDATRSSAGWARLIGTFGVASGKWYFEAKSTNNWIYQLVGVGQSCTDINNFPGYESTSWGMAGSDGQKWNNNSGAAYGAGTTGDLVSVALDMDTGKIWFAIAGAWQASGNPATGANPAFTGLSGTVYPMHAFYNATSSGSINFGQRPFSHTPPTGFKALCQKNLPDPVIPKPSLHFDVKTYAGSGSVQTIGSSSFYKLTYPYSIGKSLRCNASSSNYLSRTPAAGNRTQFTFSCWFKGFDSTNGLLLLTVGVDAYNYDQISIDASGKFRATSWNGAGPGVNQWALKSNRVFCDATVWNHVVFVYDSAQGTPSNRLKVWFNGVQDFSFSSVIYPSPSFQTYINSNNLHRIMSFYANAFSPAYSDGYISEFHFVDGLSMTASDFGQWDSTGTTWIPKSYIGTYGANGFYLDFSTGTTQATLGYDKAPISGAHTAANNWTLNNFTAGTPGSIGVNEMWMSDTPTNNYYILLPNLSYVTNPSISNGNLQVSCPNGSAWGEQIIASYPITSGKWYWEVTPVTNASGYGYYIGVAGETKPETTQYVMYINDATKTINETISAYGSSYSNSNLIGIALDFDASSITFYKDNISQGTISFSSYTKAYPTVRLIRTATASGGYTFNFGQRAFTHSPPAGFNALCTANASAPASTDWMPSLAIIKSRTNAYDWCWADNMRGAFMGLASNSTAAEAANTNTVQKFFLGGIQVGGDNTTGAASNNYVSYLWKCGTPTTNTAGSITSVVSANTSAGFSIVTYTGTGANATVGHGLGIEPKMIIVKRRGAAGYGWIVGHTNIGWTNYLALNQTQAAGAQPAVWQSTAPSSTVFSVGTDIYVNDSSAGNTYVAYCFAEIEGYSKFGSYTGNGSTDGPFVWCGFRPKFILLKRTDGGTEYWQILDSAIGAFNTFTTGLQPSSSASEFSTGGFDILSNGFKLRVSGAPWNSVGSYIFIAFADVPFKYSNAR